MQMSLKYDEVKRLEYLTAVGPVRFLFPIIGYRLALLRCISPAASSFESRGIRQNDYNGPARSSADDFYFSVKSNVKHTLLDVGEPGKGRTQPNLDRPLCRSVLLAPRSVPSEFGLFYLLLLALPLLMLRFSCFLLPRAAGYAEVFKDLWAVSGGRWVPGRADPADTGYGCLSWPPTQLPDPNSIFVAFYFDFNSIFPAFRNGKQ